MRVLVTGGAGYIGSHVVHELVDQGHEVEVFDNLSTGHKENVPDDVVIRRVDVADWYDVYPAYDSDGYDGVIHLAGYKYAGESVKRPHLAYHTNVLGTMNILRAMTLTHTPVMVFSSSAAVYGTPVWGWVSEYSAMNPESPYGETKLIGEWLIRDYARVFNLRHTSLRYFNVVGRGKGGPDLSPHNLFPRIKEALSKNEALEIFGTEYATVDGTAVRDYLYVGDLAKVHVTALQKLTDLENLDPAYNIGTGIPTTVKQVMEEFKRQADPDNVVPILYGQRRQGDPAAILTDSQNAQRDLGWKSTKTVAQMIKSTLKETP